MNQDEIAQKLSILEKKTSELISVSTTNDEVSSYLKATKKAIKEAQKDVREIGSESYSDKFPIIAYKILSSSPFTTKAHLCIAFRKSLHEIDKWISENPEFEKCIDQGILEGEIIARDLMVQASFEPANKVNTALLKTLSNNVYNIKESQDLNLKAPEQLKFQIEVVSATKD